MGYRTLSRQYESPFKSGQTVDWLLGNVGDWQRLTVTFALSTFKAFQFNDTISISDPNKLILNGGEKWEELGFYTGLTCELRFDHVDTATQFAITNFLNFDVGTIVDDEMECFVVGTTTPLNGWGYQFGQVAPQIFANFEIKDVFVIAVLSPNVEGIQIDYSHFTNSLSPSGNLISFVDGTKTSLVKEGTDENDPGDDMALNVTQPFTHLLNFQSGLSIINSTITYLGQAGIEHNFAIQLVYMLCPFYDTIQNFIDMVAPDSVKGVEAITDNWLISGFPVYNNPNITIKNIPKKTEQEGNTGWFNENFNQLPNPFTFTPVVYTNLNGDIVGQLDYGNPIVMTTTVSGILNLSGLSTFQYGFIWTSIDEDVYKSTDYPFHENLKVSTGGQAATLNDAFSLSPVIISPFPATRLGYTISGSGTTADDSRMDVSNIGFVQNGADVDITLTFRPNPAFSAFIGDRGDNDRNYALWVSVGDQSKDVNDSDRVSLLLDFNQMVTVVVPVGPYPGMTIDFLDHPQIASDTPIPCGNDIYVEDDLLARVLFQEETLTGPGIPIINSITFGFLAENSITGQQYVLDTSKVDLTVYPDPTQYNFDVIRDFKLGVGNSKNFFKVFHNAPADVGTLKGVKGEYGYKVRWEDWIKRLNVPAAFYDNTEPQNGLNNDWFHYFNTSSWNVFFYVNIGAVLDGQNVVYQNLKELTIKDYDSNGTITTTLTYYRNIPGFPDTKGALLTGGIDPITGDPLGVIIEDEIVWLDILYTSTGTPWANQADVDANSYATQCIEVDGGGGQFTFRQLSSIFLPELDIPMIPIPGETLAKVVFVPPNQIRVETRIEANKLIDSSRYKVTGREGCK